MMLIYIRSTLILIALLCTLSCSRTSTFPETMLRAESLMNSAPDRAMALLSGYRDSVRTENQTTQMYYWLLTVKANDKCYVPHTLTSDSLMKTVVNYYENTGRTTPKLLMQAYYYQGSVYRDLGNAPRALDYYQQAVDASQDGTEYQLLASIYGEMGMLYMYQKLYDEALPIFRNAYNYCSLANDSASASLALRDIGRTFTTRDSVLHYYEWGYQVAKRINDVGCMSVIQSELADVYMQLGQYEKARVALIQSSIGMQGDGNLAPHYLSWADLYKTTGQLDSAAHYYRKALDIGNVYVKEGACEELFQIARLRARADEAFAYLDQHFNYRDSVLKITDTEAVKRVQMLYNYRHVEKENDRLALVNAKNKTFLYQLLISTMVLFIVIVGIFHHYRKRKEQQLAQERRLYFFEKQRHEESLFQIELNNEQIARLKEQLVVAQKQNNLTEEELLAGRSRLLEERNSHIKALCAEREALINAFHQSEIYLVILEKSNDPSAKLSEEEWVKLQIELDLTFDHFTNRLYTLYPHLTEVELRVCYLLKIAVSSSNIAHLIVRAKSSVSSIRERLYKKIHGVDGKPKMLDAFILDF